MAGRFEAVLFDLGGVFTGSPMAALETLGEELGAEPGHLFEIIFGPEGSDGDHPWHRLERGELPLPRAAEEIATLGARESLEIDLGRVFALLGEDGGSPHQVAEHAGG